MTEEITVVTTKILVIDDDALVRESICVYLEDCGYDVLQTGHALEGLRMCAELQPSVVLCDLRMPDIDGLKVLETLAREQPGLPVIVVSGAGVMTDVVEALRLGASDYLVKPIPDLAVLEHAVKSVIHKVQLESENQQYRDELLSANEELAENLDVLQRDHEVGRQAQLQLLPEPLSHIGDWEFSHAVVPSLYLSGDFLDYFEIDDRYIGFYLADISGHGAASAFVTMMLKSLINHPLRRYRSHGETTILNPAELLAYLNTEVIQSNLGKYLTLFYGVIDRHHDTIRFTNGGQYPRPLFMQNKLSAFLGESSFPVGLFDWATYQVEERQMPKGSQLLLCSDGVLEIPDDSVLAKNESLILSFAGSGTLSVPEILQRVKRGVHGVPIDDIAIFLIRHL